MNTGPVFRERKERDVVHTHFSAQFAAGVFLCVLVMGTLWRLLAAYLSASNNPLLSQLGNGMAFQY